MKWIKSLGDGILHFRNYSIICAISTHKWKNRSDQLKLFNISSGCLYNGEEFNISKVDEKYKCMKYLLVHTYQNGWDSWGDEYVGTVDDLKELVKYNFLNLPQQFIDLIKEYIG
ncbi:hypothetical protein [Metaclostridioides mangenotii]|uniref:hypothetical protein n=1 Tax=Metaclostridioides mangenotii TaxID=1540 RepID=UPI000465AB50|nr:hypothetical protein [Clostridioides mangenotii]